MKSKLLLVITLFFFIVKINAQSNLFIDTTYTVEEMVMDFFDDTTITVSNVTFNAPNTTIGFFDAGGTDLDLDLGAGIVFCTGDVASISGPSLGNITGFTGTGSDSCIAVIEPFHSNNDAVALEFDFTVASSDTLSFNYVFGSEEYPEWVGSAFNDVFAFLISGPGLNGPFPNNAVAISNVPNTMLPVAINNVNNITNNQFYFDNSNGPDIAYDGFTTSIPASFYAVGGETYHIKIVIADISDTMLDSGIFLSFNSLGQDSLLVPPTDFDFAINSSTNTVDFSNESKYARSWHWDFGDNQTSDERNPGPITYSAPGIYTVTLTTENYCCTETKTTQIEVGQIPLSLNTTVNHVSCFGGNDGSIDIEVIGGTPPFTIPPNLVDLPAGVYSISVSDANGISVMMNVEVTEPAELEVENLTLTPATGNNFDGSASVTIMGGVPPYSYLWSNGETGSELLNVGAGDYSLTVTDANNCEMMTTLMIESVTSLLRENDFSISIFPNPVKDQLQMEWLEISNIKNLRVFDVAGKDIAVQKELKNNSINLKFAEHLKAGTYMVQVELENGKTAVAKFIAN